MFRTEITSKYHISHDDSLESCLGDFKTILLRFLEPNELEPGVTIIRAERQVEQITFLTSGSIDVGYNHEKWLEIHG